MLVGYARVSSVGQNLASQVTALKEAGCEKIFTEKKSGKQTAKRPILQEAIDYCRSGDVFIVTRLDRCSRSVSDLQLIIRVLASKDISFKATEQNEIDTTTSGGRLMLNMLASFAEFETDLRAERQADGIKDAKKRGVVFGRAKAGLSDNDIVTAMKMQEDGYTGKDIAKKFGVARSTLLKYIKNYRTFGISINPETAKVVKDPEREARQKKILDDHINSDNYDPNGLL